MTVHPPRRPGGAVASRVYSSSATPHFLWWAPAVKRVLKASRAFSPDRAAVMFDHGKPACSLPSPPAHLQSGLLPLVDRNSRA